MKLRPTFRNSGFSLVELLVVLAIIAILAGLSYGSYSAITKSANKAEAASQLHQIGIALNLYRGDNYDRLPGPLWPGQQPYYDPDEDEASGRLVNLLAPYMEIREQDKAHLVDLFIPPAYRKEYDGDLQEARTYVMNFEIPIDGEAVNPWGDFVEGDDAEPPMKAAKIPLNVWLMSDADQENPRVMERPWMQNTPEEPVHGDDRLGLFIDARVETVPLEDLESPTTEELEDSK